MQGLVRTKDKSLISESLKSVVLLLPVVQAVPRLLREVLHLAVSLLALKELEVEDSALRLLETFVSSEKNVEMLQSNGAAIENFAKASISVLKIYTQKKSCIRLLTVLSILLDHVTVNKVSTFIESLEPIWNELRGTQTMDECAPLKKMKDFIVFGNKYQKKKRSSRVAYRSSGSESSLRKMRERTYKKKSSKKTSSSLSSDVATSFKRFGCTLREKVLSQSGHRYNWFKVCDLLNSSEIVDTLQLPPGSANLSRISNSAAAAVKAFCNENEPVPVASRVDKVSVTETSSGERSYEDFCDESNSDAEQYFDAVSDIEDLDSGVSLYIPERTLIDKMFQPQLKSLRMNSLLAQRPGVKVEAVETISTDVKYAAKLAMLITAFANTDGGTIFIGMKGKGLVSGVRLNKKDMDEFSLLLDSITYKFIHPRMKTTNLLLEFFPIENSYGKKVSETFLIKIQVKMIPGVYHVTHNIPGEDTAMYRRKGRGPNHTYLVSTSEALQLLGTCPSVAAQTAISTYINHVDI